MMTLTRSWSQGYFGTILIAILLLAGPAPAQQVPSLALAAQFPEPHDRTTAAQETAAAKAPAAPQEPDKPAAKQDQDKEDKNKAQVEQTGTSKDRLFYTLPNFLSVENAGQIPPLSAGQKFKVVARSSFDYIQIPWYGFLAGISQAENSEPGYGQGAAGYGKRFGSAFADGAIENFWASAILPSALHQDPRFYQLGKGGFWHRTGYAMSRIIITRSDSGNTQFNASEVFGSAIAAGISTYSYHPHADKTLSNTLSVWGSQIGYDTLSIVVKEFWPDIRRKISHK